MIEPASITIDLKERAHELGFDLVGMGPVRPSDDGEFYRRWIGEGYHGEMAYLAREDAVAARIDPARAWPGLISVVVLGMNYYLEDDGAIAEEPANGIISRYARGRDYHRIIRKKLLELLRWLEDRVGQELPLARAYVDTGPIFEREQARRAGLGWQGQNTMLINPRRGSYLFLASLLIELELEYDEPFAESHCGTCSACVEACPTGALLGWDDDHAPLIDATRCISYLTIEQRGEIPRELRPAIGNRIFGCDICQEVCPWNSRKFVQITREPGFAARGPGEPPVGVQPSGTRRAERGTTEGDPIHPGTSHPSLIDLLAMGLDESAWDEFSRGSPIRRAGRAGFLRNLAVALGNWLGSVDKPPEEAVTALVRALGDPEPLVRGHAAWALGRVGVGAARVALEEHLTTEDDLWVREELELALTG